MPSKRGKRNPESAVRRFCHKYSFKDQPLGEIISRSPATDIATFLASEYDYVPIHLQEEYAAGTVLQDNDGGGLCQIYSLFCPRQQGYIHPLDCSPTCMDRRCRKLGAISVRFRGSSDAEGWGDGELQR